MFIVYLLSAYLAGSIATGKIIGNLHGIDIQKTGSGNIGFANSVRVLGWRSGLIILAGDILKGYVPVAISANHLTYQQTLVVGLAAIIGHLFPFWLKFKGGKGIATGLGVALAISPVTGLLGLAMYLIGFAIFRKSGLASVLAAWSLPISSFILDPKFVYFSLLMALIATWTHRTNLHQYYKEKHDK